MISAFAAPVEFSTKRLHLRRPRFDDAAQIFKAYASDRVAARFTSWRAHETEDETRTYLQRCLDEWSDGTGYPYAIELAAEALGPVGNIHLHKRSQRMEFGYVLARPYWGQGYMTEALSALVDWSLEQPGIWRASAFCDIDNHASARVMENAGMTFEGILRRFFVHPNISPEPRDCRIYAKVRS